MSRILIVDDEPEITRLLSGYLASKGHEAHTAANTVEAVRKIKEVRPDVVLLDLIMPGQNGIEALKVIKAFDPDIAVILVTAVIDEQLISLALDSGADAHLAKPFQLEDILKALDFVTGRRGQRA